MIQQGKQVQLFFVFMLAMAYLLFIARDSCPAEKTGDTTIQTLSPEQLINPHFSGKDCNLCHLSVPEPGQKDIQLKFGGDDIKVCNWCHETQYVKGDLHPVGIVPQEGNIIHIDEKLPLYNGEITCRTCHDVYTQCRQAPAKQFENINFLRGGPYKKTVVLCFRCHNRDAYKKTNPHEQLDKRGNIIKERCLYCHQSMPDTVAVSDIKQVTFKTETAKFCAACHGEEQEMHPAGANHIVDASPEMISAIESSEKKYQVILPLFKGEIFCGTCHNPHDKGVIKRKKAAKGTEEKHRLRLDWSYDLCVACHTDKEGLSVSEITIDIRDQDLRVPTKGEGVPTYHKSFLEKKCRACHRITRESPERPTVYKTCFQIDCHNASLVAKTFKHTDAEKGNCLLCHNAHGSQYGAHILNDQKKLCKACHVLLRDKQKTEKQERHDEKGEDFHQFYHALFQKLVTDRKFTCSYCHGEDHTQAIKQRGIVPCYQCHNYIKRLVKGKRGKPTNVHDTFHKNKCTECHEPHSSDYRYLLRNDPESYL